MSTFKLAPKAGDAALAAQWLEQARCEGRSDGYVGKRQQLRYTWDPALEVHVTDRRGRTETFYANAKDISEGGMGLQCRKAIPLYSTIKICMAGEMTGVTAVVTHCTPTLAGHLIGTQFRFEELAEAETRAVKVG